MTSSWWPQLAIPWVSISHFKTTCFCSFTEISDFQIYSKQCPAPQRLAQGMKSLRWPVRACVKATLLPGLVCPEKPLIASSWGKLPLRVWDQGSQQELIERPQPAKNADSSEWSEVSRDISYACSSRTSDRPPAPAPGRPEIGIIQGHPFCMCPTREAHGLCPRTVFHSPSVLLYIIRP